jgi:hypothetical protein
VLSVAEDVTDDDRRKPGVDIFAGRCGGIGVLVSNPGIRRLRLLRTAMFLAGFPLDAFAGRSCAMNHGWFMP